MLKQEIHFFMSTLGSAGYVSYYDSNFGGLKTAVRLFGYPGQLAEQLVETIQKEAEKRGCVCEIIHQFLSGRPEGIILPEKNAGLVNIPCYLLGEENVLAVLEDERIAQVKKELSEAETCMKEAKKIHDEWEKIYVANMDFGAADSLAEEMCKRIVGAQKGAESAKVTDRFLGAATADGSVDQIENITQNLPKRFFIKGRPGTGKSTFLRKIAQAASAAGFCAEQYHCSFDPKSLDMVVVRGLGVCLFDSTAPHEYFPSRVSDEIVDIYETAVTPGTDETYEKELTAFSAAYKLKVLEAKKALSRAQASEQKIQAQQMAHVDWLEYEKAAEKFCGMLLEK